MNLTEMFRHYIDLIEAAPVPVIVTINGYEAVPPEQMGSPPFPTALTVHIDGKLSRDEATLAVKAEIQAATGYEPSHFSWHYHRRTA